MSDGKRLLTPPEVARAREPIGKLLAGLNRALIGREDVIEQVLIGFLARGHILLEGLPGLGKTELVKALAALLALKSSRVQFTPDLLPGDITGTAILEERDGRRELVFRQGPVFANILLADEINRASPKTQSALLEAMQERRVTVLGKTYDLPDPFFVLATQNPIELEGTYPLPEAQIDRFLFKIKIAGVREDVLKTIVLERKRGEPPRLEPVVDLATLRELFELTDAVLIPEAVGGYISRLVAATHRENPGAPENVARYVRWGASPRGAIAIAGAARARALIQGRPNAGFDDVRAVALPALGHRLILDYSARLDDLDGFRVAERLIETVPDVPRDVPSDVRG